MPRIEDPVFTVYASRATLTSNVDIRANYASLQGLPFALIIDGQTFSNTWPANTNASNYLQYLDTMIGAKASVTVDANGFTVIESKSYAAPTIEVGGNAAANAIIGLSTGQREAIVKCGMSLYANSVISLSGMGCTDTALESQLVRTAADTYTYGVRLPPPSAYVAFVTPPPPAMVLYLWNLTNTPENAAKIFGTLRNAVFAN